MFNKYQMKESSLRDLDDKMKWLKNFERLLEIQVRIAVIIVTIVIVKKMIVLIIIIFVNKMIILIIVFVNKMIILILSEMWSGLV